MKFNIIFLAFAALCGQVLATIRVRTYRGANCIDGLMAKHEINKWGNPRDFLTITEVFFF